MSMSKIVETRPEDVEPVTPPVEVEYRFMIRNFFKIVSFDLFL